MLRLLVVSADPLVRTGLTALLDGRPAAPGGVRLAVVQALPPEEAADPDLAHAADVVVWDAGEEPPSLASGDLPLVLLAHPELGAAAVLGSAPPVALLPRAATGAQISAAAAAVAAGLVVVAPEFLVPASQDFAPRPTGDLTDLVGFQPGTVGPLAGPAPSEPLTPRELEVLRHLADGLANKGVAARLGISEHTVKFHVNSLLAKLQARSRTEAVAKALRLGLVPF